MPDKSQVAVASLAVAVDNSELLDTLALLEKIKVAADGACAALNTLRFGARVGVGKSATSERFASEWAEEVRRGVSNIGQPPRTPAEFIQGLSKLQAYQ